MKTIEEKSKAYDEAIKRLRNAFYDNNGRMCEEYRKAVVRIIEPIFPELKESERIRQLLLRFVEYDMPDNYSDDFSKEDCLAWIKNQGEKKPTDKIVEKARVEKQRVLLTETDGSANIDWDCRSLDDVKTLLKCGLEFIRTTEADKQILTDSRFGGCSFRVPTRYDKGIKQGEQKSNIVPIFKVGDIIKNKKNGDTVKVEQILSDSYCYSGWDGAATIHSDFLISDQGNWELVEQKAAWSEEDEINLEKAIWYVENPAPMVVKDSMLVEWLKSLKDRVQPQSQLIKAQKGEKNMTRKEVENLKEMFKPIHNSGRRMFGTEAYDSHIKELLKFFGYDTEDGVIKEIFDI